MPHVRFGDLRLHFAENEVQDYQYIRALSYQLYGGASSGECLRVARRIKAGGNTRDAWVTCWAEQGRLSHRMGEEALSKGHLETARPFFLRAYNYLRAAEFYFDRQRDGAQAHRALYRESVASFDAAIRLMDQPIEKVAIPYLEGVLIPGYFFKASSGAEPRPTVIISGGGDSFGEESYFTAGVPEALARGLNVLVFHGPGQRGLLHEHPEQVFRPDTEVYIGKVIDYALSRPDVEASQLGLYGYSFGGYLAPRAAAFDPRVKALVANTFIRDDHELILGGLLDRVPAALHPVAKHAVGSMIELAMHRDWVVAATVELYLLWTTGTTTVEEMLDFVRPFTLAGLEQRITCPTLGILGEGEGEAQVRQAQQFYDALTCPKAFVPLTTELGADNHCGLNNITYTAGVIFDWFCDVFTGRWEAETKGMA